MPGGESLHPEEKGTMAEEPQASEPRKRFLAVLLTLLAALGGLAIVSGRAISPEARLYLDSLRHKPGPTLRSAASTGPANAAAASFGATNWYFAHGYVQAGAVHTWLLLANPGSSAADAVITLHADNGDTRTASVNVPAASRYAYYANQSGISGDFSAAISSSLPLVAEESVFFANDAYTVPGVAAPASTWYLPEGFNGSPYSTTIHVYNPGSSTASLTFTFYGETPAGGGAAPTQTLTREVAAGASLHLPLAGNCTLAGGVSTRVQSSQPVVVQRVTYWPGANSGQGGHATSGSAVLASTWYLPLVSSVGGLPLDNWLLLLNPGDSTINLEATYLSAAGSAKASYQLAPRSRTTLWLAKEQQEGRAPAGAFAVTFSGDGQYAVESVAYDSHYYTGTATAGSPAAARQWYFAEGSMASPYTTYLALYNPGPAGALVRAALLPSDAGPAPSGWALLPGEAKVVQLSGSQSAGISLSSDEPIVAERVMTMSGYGLFAAIGLPGTQIAGRPLVYIPIAYGPVASGPTPTPTAVPVPVVTRTPVRPPGSTAFLLVQPIVGTANCGTTGLKGRITDAAGQPLAGMKVRVWADGWAGVLSLPSDAAGNWNVLIYNAPRDGTWYAAVSQDDGTLLSPIIAVPTWSDCRNGQQWQEIDWQQRSGQVPDYQLAWARRMTCIENCFNHNLFIDVTDADGNGLAGVTLRVSWDGGQVDVVTGNKLDVGPGRVEFAMYKGTYSVRVLSAGGAPVSSDVASGLTVDLPDDTTCTNGGNRTYHYSYHIVFRRSR